MDIIINADQEAVSFDEKQKASKYRSFWIHFLISLAYSAPHLPIADFLRQYHGLEGEWLLCEPIYWEAFHNDAMLLADARMLGFTEEQSRALFADVRELLSLEGISLYYHDAFTWLLQAEAKAKINCPPTYDMLSQSMMPILKEMDTSLYWQKLMTELQMFLYQDKYRSFPVNGFWIYGSSEAVSFKRDIFTNDKQLLTAFPNHVQALNFEKPVPKHAIIVLSHDDKSYAESLDKLKKQYPIRWFWNNTIYETKPDPWWKRFKEHNAHKKKRMS